MNKDQPIGSITRSIALRRGIASRARLVGAKVALRLKASAMWSVYLSAAVTVPAAALGALDITLKWAAMIAENVAPANLAPTFAVSNALALGCLAIPALVLTLGAALASRYGREPLTQKDRETIKIGGCSPVRALIGVWIDVARRSGRVADGLIDETRLSGYAWRPCAKAAIMSAAIPFIVLGLSLCYAPLMLCGFAVWSARAISFGARVALRLTERALAGSTWSEALIGIKSWGARQLSAIEREGAALGREEALTPLLSFQPSLSQASQSDEREGESEAPKPNEGSKRSVWRVKRRPSA